VWANILPDTPGESAVKRTVAVAKRAMPGYSFFNFVLLELSGLVNE
jgi:hypothetical protein